MVSPGALALEASTIEIPDNSIASLGFTTLILPPAAYVLPRVEDSFVGLAKNDNLVKIELQENCSSVLRFFRPSVHGEVSC